VTQFPPWSSHSPVCTITAVSKDLVRRPTRISYDLSLATLSHELGVSFSRLRHDPAGKLLDQLRDALVCSYYVRCVSTQRFLADVSVNHSRTGSGKAIDNTQGRASRLSSSGVPFAGLQPVPGGRNWAAIQPPLQKDDSTLRLAYSALELSPWAMPAHAVGNPGRPGRADVAPPRPFRRSQLCTLCWPALLRRPLAVRSRLGPNVDGVAGRIQRSELLPSRDALRA